MKLALDQLFLLGLFSASIHWLVARSKIAAPIWSRARGIFDKLLRCPACSGFWIGMALDLVVQPLEVSALGIAAPYVGVVTSGLFGLFLTPIFEGALMWGLERSAVPDQSPDQPHGDDDADADLTESGEVTPNERPRS